MRLTVTWTLVLTLLVSPASITFADQDASPTAIPQNEPVEFRNVELTADGALQGQFITEAGVVLANRTITVRMGESVCQAQTDESGRFSVSGLKGGQCLITAGDEAFACRLWVAGTAPPASLKSVALVQPSSDATVRGQSRRTGFVGRLSSLSKGQKIGLGLLAATGIAVGVAVAQDDASN
jgi:hypothetical protein